MNNMYNKNESFYNHVHSVSVSRISNNLTAIFEPLRSRCKFRRSLNPGISTCLQISYFEEGIFRSRSPFSIFFRMYRSSTLAASSESHIVESYEGGCTTSTMIYSIRRTLSCSRVLPRLTVSLTTPCSIHLESSMYSHLSDR